MATSSYGPLAVTNNLVLDFFNSFTTMENLSISQSSTLINLYLNISSGSSVSVSIGMGGGTYVKNNLTKSGIFVAENLPLCILKFEDVIGTITFKVETKNSDTGVYIGLYSDYILIPEQVFLLIENNDYRLLENGDKRLIESK